MKTYKQYDSIFTATKIYSWFWLKNKPINYNPKFFLEVKMQDQL